MSLRLSLPLLAPCLLLSLIFTALLAHADSIHYKDFVDANVRLQNVIVISQTNDRIEYLEVENESFACRKTLWTDSERTKNLEIRYSSQDEKRALLEKWKKRTWSALVERNFGPSLSLASLGVRYPLPENVTYIMGSPEVREGAVFYVGNNPSVANPVSFKELQSAQILNNGSAVRIIWNSGEASEGTLLAAWKYGEHMGGPAVLTGMDMTTSSYVEIPLASVRRVTMTGNRITTCSGSPKHAFIDIPVAWKFCPVCGKPMPGMP